MAGTGKSTIARTIARHYYEMERLGASFFFSRGRGDLNHAGKFFPSIAIQLANRLSAIRDSLCAAIAEHRDIGTQALRDQWKQLVWRPLSKLTADLFPSPVVLVIDALDECECEDDVRAILQLLAETRGLPEVRLRVFVTSRPETPVRLGFRDIPSGEHRDLVLHHISPSIIEHDLTVFLKHELTIIRRDCGLSSDWPGDDACEALVQKAGGLFIWAATACRFVGRRRQLAKKNLCLILQGDTRAMKPEEKLDEIYLTVLRHSIGEEDDHHEVAELCREFQQIVGSIVIAFEALSTATLAELLDALEEDICLKLDGLHSVLEIAEDQGRFIRLLHPSFRDFLLDQERCSDQRFRVEEQEAHAAMGDRCVVLMSKGLKRDVCNLQLPGVLLDDADKGDIERCLPPDLQYACRYWVQHLERSNTSLRDGGSVHVFLQQHLLHWLETLSLMGKVSEGVLMILSLRSMVKVSHDVKDIGATDTNVASFCSTTRALACMQ